MRDYPASGAATSQGSRRWICSNCGHHQAFPKVKLRAGSSVWLDRGAYWFRSIQRDEMVALEQLEIGLRVKRVVGLPGETIGIKNGDLWVGAERYTKTLSQLRERAVLVHDDRFRAPDQTHRWQPFADAGWTPVATGYALEKPSESWQYLRYEHRSPYGVNRLWEVSRVLDDDHFNQHVRRRMFPCADLWLQVKLEAIAGPSFSGQVRMLLWTPDGVRSATFAVAELPAVLEIAWLDGKLWTRDADGDHDWGATDQTPEVPYQPDSQASETENTESDGEPLVTATHPLALAIRGSTPCRVTNLRVSRDLVLLGPPGHELDWTSEPIGEGEYFVLGDNVAVSIDGRTESQGVAAKQIVGKVEKN